MPKKAAAKAKKVDLKTQIVLKALQLAEEQGWDQVTLGDIAREADLSLAELFDHVEDKMDVLALFGKMIDRQVLEVIGEPDPSISPRDQLFDILMERYEILNDYRPGLLAVLESFKYDPKQALFSAPYLVPIHELDARSGGHGDRRHSWCVTGDGVIRAIRQNIEGLERR